MTALGDLVHHLMSAGLDADQVRHAVDLAQRHAIEVAPKDHAAERRRAADRERKRKKSGGIPRNSAEDAETATIRNPIPVGWSPSPSDVDYAIQHGWDGRRTAQEAERFANHWRAKGELRADWSASWRNWVTAPWQQHKESRRDRPSIQEAAWGLAAKAAAGLSRLTDEMQSATGPGTNGLAARMLPSG